jgi:ectoine hydroxylase-related dioxygenase (phytanoyl-CoA dioxygenase family)
MDTAELADSIFRDGYAGLPAAFSRDWALQLRRDFDVLFGEALEVEDGTVSRGPQRHYLAVHAERLAGFLELVTQPAIVALCRHMLGDDYEVVEVAFDVPLPGAVHQPWHRDFPMPPETADDGRLSSLAFNVTAADVRPEMGPFELAPGTHFDPGDDFEYSMFPPETHHARYAELATQRMPRLGDASARTGLAIHRGTPNVSDEPRPVLVLGVVEAGVETEDAHALELTGGYLDALPADVRRHLRATRVDELRPIRQLHSIEGLVMGG